MNILSSKSTFGKMLISFLYVFTYDYIYKNYMFVHWSYMGNIEYKENDFWLHIYYYSLSILPVFFYSGTKSISSVISFFVYLLAYIPLIFSLFISNNVDYQVIISYSTILFFSMCAIFWINDKRVILFKRIRHCCNIRAIEILTILLIIFLIVNKGHSLKFVNVLTESDKMYELRADYSESSSLVSNYIQYWLRNALIPFLFVNYLVIHNKLKIAVTFITFLLMFMLDMQKITLIMPFLILGIYYAVTYKELYIQKYFHSALQLLMSISALLLCHLCNLSSIAFAISSIYILRTFCIEGWLGTIYLNFFNVESHPYTYYSHINIINFLTQSYPYNEVLGKAVTFGGMNANATFWITDGIAAGGAYGLIFISVLFIIFLLVLNNLGRFYKSQYLIPVFFPIISTILNASLFTAILSGGVWIIVLILLFSKNNLPKI